MSARIPMGPELGIVGLGVMGHGLALNAADHGVSIVGFDRDREKMRRLEAERGDGQVRGAVSIERLVTSLAPPRAVLLMVPAGPAVDAVIHDLRPHLRAGDLLLDGGNSFYRDTVRRAQTLADEGLHFLGLGISGGAHGARHGPCLMPGGALEDYERVRPILEAIAARVDGLPCVAHLGPGGAGHYVKMVHNGIEYAVMQLIAETYDVMRQALGMGDDEIARALERWNDGDLRSFLLEVTARVLRATDERSGERLVHRIVDEAGQKGTGRWCSQDAMDLGVPVPNIDVAVAMRELSSARVERETAVRLFPGRPVVRTQEPRGPFLDTLQGAFEVSLHVAYAQGVAQLRRASVVHRFGLDLAEVARIWRGGCIIRAALLQAIQSAYRVEPELPSPMFAPDTARLIAARLAELRFVVAHAATLGIPAPGLMTALAYVDSLRSAHLPANLIQAQRDCFGGHGFERIDEVGTFHGSWEEPPGHGHAG